MCASVVITKSTIDKVYYVYDTLLCVGVVRCGFL